MMLDFVLDLFFPKNCRGCGLSGAYICEECFEKVDFKTQQCCPKCRRESNGGVFCSKKCKAGFYFEQLVVCAEYTKNAALKKLLILFKYKFSRELSCVFKKMMEVQFFNYSDLLEREQSVFIVPVPLHKSRLKYRGFNQSKVLAEQILSFDERFEIYDCLKKTSNTREQARLTKTKRLCNLKNTIELKGNFANDMYGKIIILVDDIATTMSTLNECSMILKKHGVKYICAVVLARGK